MPQAQVAEYWLHPQGLYPLQLIKIEDAQGQWGAQIKWTWETPEMQVNDLGEPIVDDEGIQRKGRLVDFTSCTASAKSGLGKLLTAMGIPLPTTKDEAAKMDDAWFQKLIGKRVTGQVIHNLLTDGRVFANVQTYAPIGKGGGKAGTDAATSPTPAAPTPAPAPEGCPDPTYDHALKQGDDGYDPFHASECAGAKTAA